jgi:hypothetical protein
LIHEKIYLHLFTIKKKTMNLQLKKKEKTMFLRCRGGGHWNGGGDDVPLVDDYGYPYF